MPKMPMRRQKIAMPRGLSSLTLSLCKSIYSNLPKDVLFLLFTLNSVIEHSFHSKSSPMPSPSLLALREIPRRITASATCLGWRARSQNSPILYQLPFLIISWSICHQRYRRLALGDYRDSGKNCSRFGEQAQRLCLRSKHSPAEKGGSLWNLWKTAGRSDRRSFDGVVSNLVHMPSTTTCMKEIFDLCSLHILDQRSEDKWV